MTVKILGKGDAEGRSVRKSLSSVKKCDLSLSVGDISDGPHVDGQGSRVKLIVTVFEFDNIGSVFCNLQGKVDSQALPAMSAFHFHFEGLAEQSFAVRAL